MGRTGTCGLESSQCDTIVQNRNQSTPYNYRPVSLTSVVCNVLESIIKDAIMEHLDDQHKLIEVSQREILPRVSRLTNMFEYLDSATKPY